MKKIKKQIPMDSTNVTQIGHFVSTEFSDGFNDKTNEIISSFFSLIDYEKIGLVNVLSLDEAMFLCDVMYTKRYNTEISPKTFLIESIKNAVVLGNINSNYNIYPEAFIEKIDKLSEHQCYILIVSSYQVNQQKSNISDTAEYINLIKKIFLINEKMNQNLGDFKKTINENRF